jgi:hypothetical protein
MSVRTRVLLSTSGWWYLQQFKCGATFQALHGSLFGKAILLLPSLPALG